MTDLSDDELRPFVADRRVLARMYREAACVVAPGPHETFGLAVLEAAASGARVVACASTPAAAVAGSLVRTYRPGGNRHPLQRLVLAVARRQFRKKESGPARGPDPSRMP